MAEIKAMDGSTLNIKAGRDMSGIARILLFQMLNIPT